MNRSRVLVAAIALVVAGVAWAAPQAPAAGTAPPHQPMAKLDVNNDRMIDRAEAARNPRLAEKFDALDRNRDGRLDASERPSRQGKRGAMGGKGMRQQGLRHVVKLDTDGDGRISRTEAAAMPKFAARFEQVDGNRDGYVVRSELRASAERHRGESQARHRERFEAKFASADSNRDGRLSRAEVEAGMPRMAQAFAFHDEDRDGFLTRADLQPKPRR